MKKSAKRKISWVKLGLFVVTIALIIYIVVHIIVSLIGGINNNDKNDIYTICSYSKKQTLAAIEAEDKEHPVAIADYNFYGESLNLFFDDYYVGTDQSIVGKTVVLKDMCSEQEIVFDQIGAGLDNQLVLSNLKAGYYAVYIKDNETLRRVYMTSKVVYDNTFTTIVRNGQMFKVELVADKAMFNTTNATEDYLDKNYLYLDVKTVEATASEESFDYDIAIATAPQLVPANVSEVGEKAHGTSEAKELYDVAEMVKAELEAAGYRVVILKDPYDELVSYYGSDGVLGRAYRYNVKYMLYLDMTVQEDTINTGVYYSNYTDGLLAQAIFNEIYNNTSLFTSEAKLKVCKLVTSKLLEDGINYDEAFEIREAGGEVLGAGKYSETAQENSFASFNIYGINTVKISPCSLLKTDSFNQFTTDKDNLAHAIAQGLINYLK